MKKWPKVVLPIVVILIAALGAGAMYLSRKEPETRVPETPVPVVRVMRVELQDLRLSVRSQGTVSPRHASTLVPEVAGTVIEVASSFAGGGFFEAGEILLQIDPHDYKQALVQARANVSQAELRLAQEMAEADVAREEWKDLGGGEASPLTLREPQVAEAEAARDAAAAAEEKAERDLERTRIRAPYAGRVREKLVDVGQYVTPGTPVARVYAVDYAEIRLPLPDAELAYLDLPLDYRGETDRDPGPEVILRADFAGKTHEWRGRIVRTEGEIDPRTRMVHTVARVKDPYARGDDPSRPPLAAGLYVEAEIMGRGAEDVAVVPRSAVRNGDTVLVVDEDDLLHFRTVDVLRTDDQKAVIRSGLSAGERLCLSSLVAVTDGMRVRIRQDDPDRTPRTTMPGADG
jgi:RND family efflux transporter MFP subunit